MCGAVPFAKRVRHTNGKQQFHLPTNVTQITREPISSLAAQRAARRVPVLCVVRRFASLTGVLTAVVEVLIYPTLGSRSSVGAFARLCGVVLVSLPLLRLPPPLSREGGLSGGARGEPCLLIVSPWMADRKIASTHGHSHGPRSVGAALGRGQSWGARRGH